MLDRFLEVFKHLAPGAVPAPQTRPARSGAEFRPIASSRRTRAQTRPPRHLACLACPVPPSASLLFLPFRYLGSLRWPKVILWCYLCWYVGMVSRHFDPAPRLWLTSLGISGLSGLALILSTATAGSPLDSWTHFRLLLMPFCVSSYSALIKDQGFILLFSPAWAVNLFCLALCAAFVTAQRLIRMLHPPAQV